MALRRVEVEGKVFDISYDILNPSNKKDIVFLHGWGSNKEIMKNAFKDSFKDFRHIYVDMPGFGKSSNDYVLTTKEYAKIVDKFLSEIKADKYIIIGHSFGGKVATLLKPQILVLLASAGIVMPKKFSVKLKIKLFKLLKKLGLSKFRSLFVSEDVKGMSENMYKTFKNVVDEDFREIFRNYRGKVIIFGANNDTAVPPKAVEIQSKLLNSENIMLSGEHYFFLKKENKKQIEKKILKYLGD
ncbi:MAG: alpha/beta fold hydrolase [Nautiliaceae bacterium]